MTAKIKTSEKLKVRETETVTDSVKQPRGKNIQEKEKAVVKEKESPEMVVRVKIVNHRH